MYNGMRDNGLTSETSKHSGTSDTQGSPDSEWEWVDTNNKTRRGEKLKDKNQSLKVPQKIKPILTVSSPTPTELNCLGVSSSPHLYPD
jgi:hypothetical protein